MTKLKDAKFFSHLDLKDAYHQLELEESSREITTFITSKGLFQYKRLMFGVNSAPEIFQRRLEQLPAALPNAMNYIDDVIIFGANELEHDETAKSVCKMFNGNNVFLNKKKCTWKSAYSYAYLICQHTLSEVERRYSQTEKESLALVWAVEKFYYYLADLHFKLVTDHKPLSKPPACIERCL